MAASTRTAIGQSCGHLEVEKAGKVIELEGFLSKNITHQKKGDVRNQSPQIYRTEMLSKAEV